MQGGQQGVFLSGPLRLALGTAVFSPPPPVFMWFFLSVCVHISPSYTDISALGLEPTLVTFLLKVPVSKYSHFRRYRYLEL